MNILEEIENYRIPINFNENLSTEELFYLKLKNEYMANLFYKFQKIKEKYSSVVYLPNHFIDWSNNYDFYFKVSPINISRIKETTNIQLSIIKEETVNIKNSKFIYDFDKSNNYDLTRIYTGRYNLYCYNFIWFMNYNDAKMYLIEQYMADNYTGN